MKKIKLFLLGFIVFLSFSSLVKINASNYLEAKDYITASENEDTTQQINNFLEECHKQGKDAFFNSRTYILESNLSLVGNVSIFGDAKTHFKGVNKTNIEEQVNIIDGGNQNITIKNIIFDNIAIYSMKNTSSSWTIQENVFLNTKLVNPSIEPGLSSSLGNDGYQLFLKDNNNCIIRSNMFLRDSNSLGRCIATYRTENLLIEDNYIGILEDVENSIVSSVTKILKSKILDLVDKSSNQGYFMTGINLINYDTDVTIKGNHFSLNTDYTDYDYESNTNNLKGYHRDHLIYAKGYDGLEIVGNYFKGMPKNQDGTVKIRNGENTLIYKNVFDDTFITAYIQSGDTILNNLYISDNVFLNKTYVTDLLEYKSGNNKYITIDFLLFIRNYVNNSTLDNITIENNRIISNGLKNEQIRIYTKDAPDVETSNVYIDNNVNYFGGKINVRNITKESTSDSTSLIKGTKWIYESLTKYSNLDVNDLLDIEEKEFKIANKKIASNSKIYLDGKEYSNTVLEEDKEYNALFINSTTKKIVIDSTTSLGTQEIKDVNTLNYSDKTFTIDINLPTELTLEYNQTIDLNNYVSNLEIYELSLISDVEFCHLENGILTPKKTGTYSVTISFGGFEKTISLNVTKKAESISIVDSETIDLCDSNLSYDINVTPADTTSNILCKTDVNGIVNASISNKKLLIEPLKAGKVSVTIYSADNENIYATINITVKCQATDLVVEENFKVSLNKTYQINVLKVPETTTDSVTYESSDLSVLEVSSTGLITAKKIGSTTVTVKCGTITKTINVTVDNPATKLVIDKENIELSIGSTHTLKDSVLPTDSTDLISYSILSGDSITLVGKEITAVKAGITTILVECGNLDSKQITVNVKPQLAQITHEKEAYVIEKGQTNLSYALVCTPANYTSTLLVNVSTNVVSASINNEKLIINALENGQAVVTIYSSDSQDVKCVITFEVVSKCTDLVVEDDSITLNVNDTYNLSVTTVPADTTDKINYNTSNSNIVTIEENSVKALSVGTANIIISCNGIEKIVTVTVVNPITSISSEEQSIKFTIGDNYQLIALMVLPSNFTSTLMVDIVDETLLDAKLEGINLKLTPLMVGQTQVIVYSSDNNQIKYTIDVCINKKVISNFEVDSNINMKLSEHKLISISYDETIETDFTFTYDNDALLIENMNLSAKKKGEFKVLVTENNSGISKQIIVSVVANVITYSTDKLIYEVNERFNIVVKINDNVTSEYIIEGLSKDSSGYYATDVTNQLVIIDKNDSNNKLVVNDIRFVHYYRLSVNDKEINLNVGENYNLVINFETSDKDVSLEYIYDEKIITLKDDCITAIKAGTTNLTIRCEDQIVQIKIIINEKPASKGCGGSITTALFGFSILSVGLLILKKKRGRR